MFGPERRGAALGDVTVSVCRNVSSTRLVRILLDREGVDVELVRCQKICHGPVAGLAVDGRMEWFEHVDGIKQIAALVRMTRRQQRDRIPKPLRRRRVRSRAGKIRC
jgi:hypothetical protein